MYVNPIDYWDVIIGGLHKIKLVSRIRRESFQSPTKPHFRMIEVNNILIKNFFIFLVSVNYCK
jgi:hypothetical protein